MAFHDDFEAAQAHADAPHYYRPNSSSRRPLRLPTPGCALLDDGRADIHIIDEPSFFAASPAVSYEALFLPRPFTTPLSIRPDVADASRPRRPRQAAALPSTLLRLTETILETPGSCMVTP